MLQQINYLIKTVVPVEGDKKVWIEAVRKALLASKIISYAQGFMLIRERLKTSTGTSTTVTPPYYGVKVVLFAAVS